MGDNNNTRAYDNELQGGFLLEKRVYLFYICCFRGCGFPKTILAAVNNSREDLL